MHLGMLLELAGPFPRPQPFLRLSKFKILWFGESFEGGEHDSAVIKATELILGMLPELVGPFPTP